ncbi:lysozyme inhibitor LprI family protein [Burkholderia sp. LMG 13014]|uniref:lysozyme inhibitor LprI family protein n=1 Tax=Burkholderia sp. LMG 13014 TaxID=2709306 RepID=UPI0019637560|nr:lysozyme inhibitor LprI family protein [Burkholderia sp. LMG 13014]
MRVTTSIAAIVMSAVITLAPAISSAQTDAFRQAISTHGAKAGGELASAPKIRADGELYYLHGKIQQASESPSFLANLSPSEENEPLAVVLRKSRGMGESTDYFAVAIPKQLQKYYFDNAKIGGGFDLIGRYTSNTKYKTVSGREMQAPVFEAVYLDLWSKRQPKAARNAGLYEKCIDEAAESMPALIGCSNAEAARQDARLNTAYKAAMAAISDKDGLRAKQRQWIKARDQECAIDEDGGQAAVLTSSDCVATMTAQRAAELEAVR